MRLLVTGAAGFIGSPFVRHWALSRVRPCGAYPTVQADG